MAAHPEYDDRYWRYVVDLVADSEGRARPVVREDSAVWRVEAPRGEVTVRYAIRLPPAQPPRAAWRPFLSPTGGLVGGPHSFMYIVGDELAPSEVTFDLPAGWAIATGLTATSDPHTYFAPTVGMLVDSPALVGRLALWRFAVNGVPHRVAYWRLPDAAPFDSVKFTGQIERIVAEAIRLFGRAPYREYSFLLEDGAWGALEHANSVTVGVPSAELAKDPVDALGEIAHEYFHTWNLVRIRPAEYRGVSHQPAPPVAGLWFSEGLTMYYADLLLRRAGLPVADSTRPLHVARLIARYLASPGNARLSAEQVSRSANSDDPLALGDYEASPHLQGELIGTMLDLVIRDATAGRRSLDDVMRLMLERFSGVRGFTGGDVQEVVEEVCQCAVSRFFDAHVRRGSPIPFDRYLALAGLRIHVTWAPALDRDGRPAPDTWIRAANRTDGGGAALRLHDPASAWGRAGLHSGDRLVAVNGRPATSWSELRAVLGRVRIGDTVVMEVRRSGAPVRATVVVAGYRQPSVRLDTIPGATQAARAVRKAWLDAR
jgi:predicted metalloprotease with PDZ domain